MSDSITVRVTLDAYDMASTGRQTQVYVQIPEVARASWLLPSDQFARLKDRAWPEVLDVTHDYVTYGGLASNSSATAAWAAVREWLAKDEHRDETQAAWERDEARRHPVARKLLAEAEQLRTTLEKRTELLHAVQATACRLRKEADGRKAFGDRLKVQNERLCKDRNGFREQRNAVFATNERLHAQVEESDQARLHAENETRKARREADALKARVAELEAAPTTVYRAEHPDSGITLGHYGTPSAARAHCEATERRSWPTGTTLAFDWIEDDEDRVAELVVTAGQNEESTTGYIVTALEIPSEYDEEADQ